MHEDCVYTILFLPTCQLEDSAMLTVSVPLSPHTSASLWLLWLPLCSPKPHSELHCEDYLPCWHNVYVSLLVFHFISIKGTLIVLFKVSDQLTLYWISFIVTLSISPHVVSVSNTSLHCLISVVLTQSPLPFLQNTSSFAGSSSQTLKELVHAVISPKTYFCIVAQRCCRELNM